MAVQKIDDFEFGGVDSRSNVLNFPMNRALRCRNFRPLPAGQLRLRWGFTAPTMSTVDGSTAVHSLVYYEQYGGAQFALFGQGANLKSIAINGGAVTQIAALSNSNPWGHFRAANRMFVGNGTDFDSYDGTTLRPVGIRAANSTESAGVTNTLTTAATGTWATTSLGGYTLYMVYYNQTTGAVGNRIQIGSTFTVGTAGYSLVLSGLPSLAGVNTEWVKGIGRTNDGGQTPYWLVDANGNRIIVGNAATVATITASTIDSNQELPTRNGLPVSGLNKFTKLGNQIFAARDGDVNIYYSEDDTAFNTGEFVGSVPDSWPGDNIEPFLTGEVPTCLQSYRGECWFHSKGYLGIWSATLKAQGANPWRGPWIGGCAGQRAWVETPYGPVWMTFDKQLMGFNQGYMGLESYGYFGPAPISNEYERVLLGQIGDQYVSGTELAYLRDPEKQIDCVYVKSKDANGNPVLVIHDYLLRDDRSSTGQGYDAVYSGMTPVTLAGTGFTPRQNVRDTNGREKLWAGAADGHVYQLEDGDSDNSATYIGDYISLINAGNKNSLIAELEWQGDSNVQISFSPQTNMGLADFQTPETEEVVAENINNRFAAQIEAEALWMYVRAQLTSHPADGSLTITGEEIPVATYGRINMGKPKIGAARPEAR